MKKILSCPVCQGQQFNVIFTGKDFFRTDNNIYEFSICHFCQTIFLSSRPDQENLADVYNFDYQPYVGKYNFLTRLFIINRTKKEIKKFKHFFPDLNKVLEIGCGTGQYLKDLLDIGNFEVRGVEVDKQCSESARDNFNLDIFCGDLTQAAFLDNSFDLVIMNHVIEHLPSPVKELGEISRILKQGGLLQIKTPNYQTWERKFFGKNWFPYEIPRHLFLFSPSSIKAILEKNGFEVLSIAFEGTPNNIILSIKNFMISKKAPKILINFFDINNYFLLTLLSPLTLVLVRFFRSGRMVIFAKKI